MGIFKKKDKQYKCGICGYISKYDVNTEGYDRHRLEYLILTEERYNPNGKKFSEVEEKINSWLETLNNIEYDEKNTHNSKNACLLEDINHVRKHWFEALEEIQKGKKEGLTYTSKIWDKEQHKYIQ